MGENLMGTNAHGVLLEEVPGAGLNLEIISFGHTYLGVRPRRAA